MTKIVSKLTKIKHILLFVALTITATAALVFVLHNYSFKNVFGVLFSIVIFIGAGQWGLYGYRTGYRLHCETFEDYDTITFFIAGIGFLLLIVMAVISCLTYYNETIISCTYVLGAIVAGGIIRMYDRDKQELL